MSSAKKFSATTSIMEPTQPKDAGLQFSRASEASPLTRQEIECLRWCKEGKTNWEIGEILAISEKTTEFHLGNAMRKLGATNRITAVVKGIKSGIIPLE